MGIAMAHYTFDRDVRITEVITEAERIGGLTLKKSADGYVFKDHNIAISIDITISSDRRAVSLRQNDLGDILYSLFDYTLHSMGGKSRFDRDEEQLKALANMFPIDVKKAWQDNIKIMLFKILLSPFIAIFVMLFVVLLMSAYILAGLIELPCRVIRFLFKKRAKR